MKRFSVRWLPNLSKFCQARLNVFLTRYLPFSLSRAYLAVIGRIYYWLNRPEKQRIRDTIIQVFRHRLEPQTLKSLIHKTFRGIFDHYHEKLLMAYLSEMKLEVFLRNRFRLDGEKQLPEAQNAGKGVILVTGHYGAVEFLPAVLGLRGYPVSIIYRAQTRALAQSLSRRADLIQVSLIDADQGNVFLAAMRALKEGRILITECDEFDEWRASRDKDNAFLGYPIGYDRTLDILHKRSGAPVLTALMNREESGDYTLKVTTIAGNAASSHTGIGARCLKVLNEAIQANPDHWYQWKKFSSIIAHNTQETDHDYQESDLAAPALGFSPPLQA